MLCYDPMGNCFNQVLIQYTSSVRKKEKNDTINQSRLHTLFDFQNSTQISSVVVIVSPSCA
jgi:hypothetical protein